MPSFSQSAILPVPVEALARWHFRRGALERLVPPWSGVRVERSIDRLENGAVAVLRVPMGPLTRRWEALHEDVRPNEGFADRMIRGPFRSWRHVHRFTPVPGVAPPSSRVEDSIAYELPFGRLGSLGAGFVASILHRTFDWRHRRVANDLRRHAELAGPPLTIAVSGANGLVGRRLCAFLSTGGHSVRRLVRRPAGGAARSTNGDIAWDPERGTIDAVALEGVDAIVHLAGESIAARWSDARKRRIESSRVEGTRLLARTIAAMDRKPNVFVSASAVGFYGDRAEEPLDESSARGSGFLADVCERWELAADVARDAGVRTVHPRIGMVLAGEGGALPKLVRPFALGAGGPVGRGRQGISWVALDDLLAIILFAIRTSSLSGPVNAVAPNAIDNRGFGRALGAVLRRPAIVPLPAIAVRAAFGEMGRELLLGGAFVAPRRLLDAGFRFDFPELDRALRFELGRLHA